MNPKLLIEAFRSTGHLIINKTLINKIGLVKACIISNYIDKYQYFYTQDKNFDDWFYLKHSDVIKQLNIQENLVIRIKKELIENGIIETKMAGLPAKEFIKINFQVLSNIIFGRDPHDHGGLSPHDHGGLLYKDNKYKEDMFLLPKKENFGITLQDFDKFMEIYPSSRRGSHGKALSTWIKLCGLPKSQRPEWQRIRSAVIKQKKSEQWQIEKYIPLAATWLNNRRWLDDPKQLIRYKFNDTNTSEEKVESTALFRRHLKEELEKEE